MAQRNKYWKGHHLKSQKIIEDVDVCKKNATQGMCTLADDQIVHVPPKLSPSLGNVCRTPFFSPELLLDLPTGLDNQMIPRPSSAYIYFPILYVMCV